MQTLLSETPQAARKRPETVLIETYGCQMNLYDSGILEALLRNRGFEITRAHEEADLIVLNTCAIREKAEERVFGRLGELSRFRAHNPELRFAVVGCMAQHLGEHIGERASLVDYVLGPDQFFRLPEYISQPQDRYPVINLERGRFDYERVLPVSENPWINYVTISRGCDNICAYCVVPGTRGHQRNRPLDEIVSEVQGLSEQGVVEVMLLGQNVNAWVVRGRRFDELVHQVATTDIGRIRFMTSHPKDMTPDIVERLADCAKLCEHFHLPAQSGSNSVLSRMRRQYTRDHYLSVVDAVRRHFPHASVTTDLIVGFCGETEEEFEDTLSLVREVHFDSAFMFNYSVRSGTHAAAYMPDDVPEPVKTQRLSRLIELQTECAREANQALVGRTVEVLVDGTSRRSTSQFKGKTRTLKTVLLDAEPKWLGRLVNVRIDAADAWTLHGTPVADIGLPERPS